MKKQTVIVGMSGGVDSSVAAYLLLEQGYDVAGLFMKNWEEDDTGSYCAAAEDAKDAEAVCNKLNIPFHTVNFATEYWDNVFEDCLNDFKKGITPNPDILCNREIKFKCFLKYAEKLGADFIATGHYVKKANVNGHYQLLRGDDPNKDQSYFLYILNQQQLAKSLFPIGELEKLKVREIAKTLGLTNHDKKDSTGICFIGERKFKDFLQQYLKPNPGPIQSIDGKTVGQHEGLMYYTFGQRQGLGIGGQKGQAEAPWFVAEKNIADNILVVCQGHDNPALLHNTLTCDKQSWVDKPPEAFPLKIKAKIRYRQADQDCEVHRGENDSLLVKFTKAQRAVTPGQSIVFYDGANTLGGAIITSRFREDM